MKLDATDLRYITGDEFRVLTAVEMGSKNHEVVPTVLIVQISGLRNGGVNKILGSLAKRNLVARVQNSRYDGYRLTYGGYDYLAIRALSKRDTLYSVGNQIGVGKESGERSNIYVVADAEGHEMVLKLHRLGRISFRAIKEKRDYMGKRKSASWMYMSRLAAQKEWAFMKVLHEHGFPVPRPIDQARHCILMEFIDAYPLRQVSDVPSPGKLYSDLMDIIVRFAQAGLIHGDYNEFNILIRRDTGEPIVIDFPQMVSTSHVNAEMYFNRDVQCIRKYFRKRFRYESKIYPRFSTTQKSGDADEGYRLDVVVEASGFKKRDQEALEQYMDTVAREGVESDGDGSTDEEEGEQESGEEEEDAEGASEDITDSSQHLDIAVPGSSHGPSSLPPREGSTTAQLSDAEDNNNNDALSAASSQSRPLSRSPPVCQRSLPHSRSPSPSDLVDGTAKLSLSNTPRHMIKSKEISERVLSEVTKNRQRQQRKYHSKKGAQLGGRPKGSKAKQDARLKVDTGGWD
ncbi:RIO1-domain-containing protein [Obba rivulosa]|uniref:Serine/threonine-protein kinase RIO2 n=1 Tax=Obba rivulosa TaxID=1052685 RepID=A0A8E2DU11_9APHY|nr:RIO1-domain-containing protein [Obba rivulosa]